MSMVFAGKVSPRSFRDILYFTGIGTILWHIWFEKHINTPGSANIKNQNKAELNRVIIYGIYFKSGGWISMCPNAISLIRIINAK